MKTTSATESEIQREGVRAILTKAGMDPERAKWTDYKYDKYTGEITYTWEQEDASNGTG
jgi:hypothetical protein